MLRQFFITMFAVQVAMFSFSTIAKAQNVGDIIGGVFGAVVVESMRRDQINKQNNARNNAINQQRKAEAAKKTQFAKRVQTALKSLGFYTMSIDGDWGRGTKSAVLAYRRAFGLYQGEFNENELFELEGYAAEGWRSATEIQESRAGGFYSRQEMIIAKEAGFSQRSIWLNAKQTGFDNANEFTIYQKSNFASPANYFSAQSGGFSNRENFLTAKELGFSNAQEFLEFRASGYDNKADFDAAATTRKLAANAQNECEKTSTNRDWIAAGSACSIAAHFNPNNSTIAILSQTAKSSLEKERNDYAKSLETEQDNLAELLANPNDLEEGVFQDSLTHVRDEISDLDAKLVRIEAYQDNINCSVAFNSNNWKEAALLCSEATSRDTERRSKNQDWNELAASMNDMAAVAKNKLKEEDNLIATNRQILALASAQKRGQVLITSVESYSLRGKRFEEGFDVVRSLVALKNVMNASEAAQIEEAISKLSDLVDVDENYVSDLLALEHAKKQTEKTSALAARQGVEQINLFLKDYVTKNITANNIGQLLELLDRLDDVLEQGNAKEMTSALADAGSIIQRENLRNELGDFVASLGAVVVSEAELEAERQEKQAQALEQQAQEMEQQAREKQAQQAQEMERKEQEREQKAQALANNIEMQEAKNSASILINDIEVFVSEGGKFAQPLLLANALVKLRTVQNSDDIQILLKNTDALNNVLQGENEFNDAKKQNVIKSAESRQNATVVAAETGRSYSAFMIKYISQNITSPLVGDMLALQNQLEQSLDKDDWQTIVISNTNIEAFLAKKDLSIEFDEYVASEQSAKDDGVELSQADNGIVINAANKELLDGDQNDILVLQNASGSSPNIGRNLFGKLTFDDDSANVCWLHKKPTASIASLLLEQEIRSLGVSTINVSSVCSENLFDNTDLILLRRGEFLELPVAIARSAILAFEDGNLKPLAKVTNSDVLSFQTGLSQSVETLQAEIMAEEREGYGLISLPNGNGDICMGTNTDLLAHNNLLKKQTDLLGLYFSDNVALSPNSLERSFVMAQRQLCSGIYADAKGMKLLLSGLEREKIPHLLVPLWIETSEYNASVAAIDETKKQRKARLLAQQQKADSEAELRSQQERTEEKLRLARQEKMRKENRDVAMGNLKIITETANNFYEGQPSDFAKLFPQTAALRNKQSYDKWSLTEKSISLVDFGTGVWRGRPVSAILAEVRYNSENAVLGQYREDCTIIGYLIDDEFNLLRDSVEAPCSVASTIKDWRVSHQFVSGWFAK